MSQKYVNLIRMSYCGHLRNFRCSIFSRRLVTLVKVVKRLTNTRSKWLSGDLTVQNVCRVWTEILEKNNVPESRVSVEYIVAHVLGRKTMHNVSGLLELSQQQIESVDAMCHQRLQHKPVQYILGEWDFDDIELQLRPPVFIPRPETEELVELAVQMIENRPLLSGRLLELCCGSGAITLSLLHRFPMLCGVAVDVSREACSLTEENAQRLGMADRVAVLSGDLTDSAVKERLKRLGPFDMLVSNPPYIPTEQMASLEPQILRYEDHRALHGGADGLDVVRHILHLSHHVLHPARDILLEIQPGQPELIQDIVSNRKPSRLQYISSLQDCSHRERFCHLRSRESMETEQQW